MSESEMFNSKLQQSNCRCTSLEFVRKENLKTKRKNICGLNKMHTSSILIKMNFTNSLRVSHIIFQ